MGDDFCHLSAHPADLWTHLVGAYSNQRGRWAAVAVQTAILGSIDFERSYAATLSALLVLRIVAIFFFTRRRTERQVRACVCCRRRVVLSVLLVFHAFDGRFAFLATEGWNWNWRHHRSDGGDRIVW